MQLLKAWQTVRKWPKEMFAVTVMPSTAKLCGGIVHPVALLSHFDSGNF